jgi:hypothetical protein
MVITGPNTPCTHLPPRNPTSASDTHPRPGRAIASCRGQAGVAAGKQAILHHSPQLWNDIWSCNMLPHCFEPGRWPMHCC